MQRITNWLVWLVVAAIAFVAILNVNLLTQPTNIQLLVAKVNAPLGLLMLGMTAILVVLFFISTMRNKIASLLETRGLVKEMQSVQKLADAAEQSRFENLYQMVSTEFRLVNERLSKLEPTAQSEQTAKAGIPVMF